MVSVLRTPVTQLLDFQVALSCHLMFLLFSSFLYTFLIRSLDVFTFLGVTFENLKCSLHVVRHLEHAS
jgi:hypothetical protein